MREEQGYLNLSALQWKSHPEDVTGVNLGKVGTGQTAHLRGSAFGYAKIEGLEVTPNTMISFWAYCKNTPAADDYINNNSDRPGDPNEPDLVAIGLCDREDIPLNPGFFETVEQWMFQIYGTWHWRRAKYLEVGGGGNVLPSRESRRYRYRSQGEGNGARWVYYEGCFAAARSDVNTNPQYLYLIARHKDYEKANVKFANIRIYEEPNLIQFPEQAISFRSQDGVGNFRGNYQTSENGYRVTASGNAWKVIQLPESYQITENTYLEAWTRTAFAGEINGVGFTPENDPILSVRNGIMNGSSNDVLPYISRYSGIQGDVPPETPFPLAYGGWQKRRFYFDHKLSLGKKCLYLMLVCDNDALRYESYTELFLARIREWEPGIFPPISTQRAYLAHKGLSVKTYDGIPRVTTWATPGIDKYILDSQGDSRNYPFYFSPADENEMIASRNFPVLMGYGGGMKSEGDFGYLDGSYYCHWLVISLDSIQPGTIETIFEIRGNYYDSNDSEFRESISISLESVSAATTDLLYTHSSESGNSFTVYNSLPYKTGLMLITCYKESSFVVSGGNAVPRTMYKCHLNGQLLPGIRVVDPNRTDTGFASNNYYLSVFSDADSEKPFYGKIYAILNSTRYEDLTNIRAIDKELMAYYGIPRTSLASKIGRGGVR